MYLLSVSVQTSLVAIFSQPGPLAARTGVVLAAELWQLVAVLEDAVVGQGPGVGDAAHLGL